MDVYADLHPPAFSLPGVLNKADVGWAGPAKTVIVVVHGFTGYEPSDRPAWAWDWLPTDNNISTFIPYKYTPADLVTKEAPSNALEREARKLLKDISPDTSYLYTFKAHGIGGAIVKKALVISYKERIFQNILGSTQAIMFFGTPCRGTFERSLDSIVLDMLEENYQGILEGDSLSAAVNRLSREIEAIEHEFSSISHLVSILNCYQSSESTGSPWRSIVTEESAKFELDNEVTLSCNQPLRDLGRIMSRQESSHFRRHLTNSATINWAVTRRCLDLLMSAGLKGPETNGQLWLHPWSPEITDRCINTFELKDWASASASDRRILRITSTGALATESRVPGPNLRQGGDLMEGIGPATILNSVSRAIATLPEATWTQLPPSEQEPIITGTGAGMTDAARMTSLCARLLWQLIYQQPRAFLYMRHHLPNLTDAAHSGRENWKLRAIWQCLRTVLHAPLGVSLYGFLWIDSGPLGGAFLKRIVTATSRTDSQLRLVLILGCEVAESLRDAGIPFDTLDLGLPVGGLEEISSTVAASTRPPPRGTSEVKLQLLLAVLEASSRSDAQLTFAVLVWVAFAYRPMTLEELVVVLALHKAVVSQDPPDSLGDWIPRSNFNCDFLVSRPRLLDEFVALDNGRLFLRMCYADVRKFLEAHSDEYLAPGVTPHLYMGRGCIMALRLYSATALSPDRDGREGKNKPAATPQNDAADVVPPATDTGKTVKQADEDADIELWEWERGLLRVFDYAAHRWIKHYRLAHADKQGDSQSDPLYAGFVAEEQNVDQWLSLCNRFHPLPFCLEADPDHAICLAASDSALKLFLDPRKINDLEILHRLALRPSNISGIGRLLVYAAERADRELLSTILSSEKGMAGMDTEALLRAIATLPRGSEYDRLRAETFGHPGTVQPENLEMLSRTQLAAQAIGNHETAAALRDELLSSRYRHTEELESWVANALDYALEYEDTDIVESLLQHYDDETKADYGAEHDLQTCHWTPIHRIAVSGAGLSIIGQDALPKLHSPASIDAYAPDQYTALFIASAFGYADLVEYLLDPGNGSNINYVNGPLGRTALHAASYHGHSKTTRVLLEHGADVTICDLEGNFPLHLAIQQGHVEVSEMLARQFSSRLPAEASEAPGAVQDSPAANSGTAQGKGNDGESYADTVDLEDSNSVLMMCSPVNRANEEGANAFFSAVEMDVRSVSQILLARDADPNIIDYRNIMALHMAARSGAVELIQSLLSKHALLNPVEGADALRPVHYACYRGHADAVRTLAASEECDLLAEDRWGRTPLAAACVVGRLAVVKVLHDHYLDNKALRVRALLAAAENGHLSVASYLLDRGAPVDDISLNALDNNGGIENKVSCSALHAAVNGGQTRIVRLLLLHGASPTTTITGGIQPLHIACQVGSLDAVKLLVDMGAPLEAEMETGDTPLLQAIANLHARVVGYLLERGARMRIPSAMLPLLPPILAQNSSTLLALVCVPPSTPCAIDMDLVRVLLRFYKQGKHEDGLTAPQAVMLALKSRSHEVLESVVNIWVGMGPERGPTSDPTVIQGLRWAIRHSDKRAVELILRSPLGRACVNDLGSNHEKSYTPLHVAICELEDELEAEKIVRLLLDAGADASIDAGIYGTPLSAACAKGKFKIARILLEDENLPDDFASYASGKYKTPIQAAIIAGQPGADTVELLNLLHARGAHPSVIGGEFYTALHAAAYVAAPPEVVSWLISKDPLMGLRQDPMGRLPLHIAFCRAREWQQVEPRADSSSSVLARLWSRTVSKVKDAQGRCGLHYAVLAATPDPIAGAIRILNTKRGEKGVKKYLNSPDIDGWTPLHWACRQPNRAIIEVLLRHGADQRIATKIDSWTPRRIAVFHGFQDYLDLFFPDQGVDAEEKAAKRVEDKACKACFVGLCGEYYSCTSECDFDLCFKCGKNAQSLHDHTVCLVSLG
ncbi:ankyrin repeat-containing domain protein [Cladorrhinum samala]|uniref:Ankyrin repeat-containing domain protein n=1 Tax=Cladorrhinum samala TaxID=585594 RepID=A0AAV9HX35_9PEZI|nr:ankyrin repeat-containing domain protein [Cladorrhinum samala]